MTASPEGFPPAGPLVCIRASALQGGKDPFLSKCTKETDDSKGKGASQAFRIPSADGRGSGAVRPQQTSRFLSFRRPAVQPGDRRRQSESEVSRGGRVHRTQLHLETGASLRPCGGGVVAADAGSGAHRIGSAQGPGKAGAGP